MIWFNGDGYCTKNSHDGLTDIKFTLQDNIPNKYIFQRNNKI